MRTRMHAPGPGPVPGQQDRMMIVQDLEAETREQPVRLCLHLCPRCLPGTAPGDPDR